MDAEPRLILPKHIEEEGPEAIKKYLDDLFSKTLFGTDSIQLDSKTHVKQEGKSLFLKSFFNFIKKILS